MPGVIGYIADNEMAVKEDQQHKRLLDDIVDGLSALRIPEDATIYREVQVPHGRVDLIAVADKIYLIEAKVLRSHSSKGSNVGEINAQLKNAYNFFLENYEVSCCMIGVYRNKKGAKFHSYQVEAPIEHLIHSSNFTT
ncbi:hypothetical protein H6503_04200 [Candidatus Woesearchaeota archaeon]|nr:hypothetical protein [Candidatus Woesearchaeota archaeon]